MTALLFAAPLAFMACSEELENIAPTEDRTENVALDGRDQGEEIERD